MVDLGVACADLSGGATDDCAGACRASWDANYTKCLEPFWQFIPAPFRPPFDRVKEACLAATAQAGAGVFCSYSYGDFRHTLLLRSSHFELRLSCARSMLSCSITRPGGGAPSTSAVAAPGEVSSAWLGDFPVVAFSFGRIALTIPMSFHRASNRA
jgi:hypothetical protein